MHSIAFSFSQADGGSADIADGLLREGLMEYGIQRQPNLAVSESHNVLQVICFPAQRNLVHSTEVFINSSSQGSY